MAIKNYTSKISVKKSIEEIQEALLKGGARRIMIDYDETGEPVSVIFGLMVEGRMLGFQLPANTDALQIYYTQPCYFPIAHDFYRKALESTKTNPEGLQILSRFSGFVCRDSYSSFWQLRPAYQKKF